MRVRLSSVPAFGHLVALLPLAAAVHRRGHEVAVVTVPTMAPVLPAHLSLLAAGPDLPELLAIAQEYAPADGPRVRPASPEGIGLFFGGLRPPTSRRRPPPRGRRTSCSARLSTRSGPSWRTVSNGRG